MQRDMVFVKSSDGLEAVKAQYPAGEHGQLFVLDDEGGYRGVIDVATLHLAPPPTGGTASRVGDLLPMKEPVLARKTPIRAMLQLFEESELENPRRRGLDGDALRARLLHGKLRAPPLQPGTGTRRSEELGHSDLYGPAEER